MWVRGRGGGRKKTDCRVEMMLNLHYVDYLQACELSRSVHPIFFDSPRYDLPCGVRTAHNRDV